MTRKFLALCIILSMSLTSALVFAELQYLGQDSLGNGLIYDAEQDITWYDYTNAPDTWFNHVSWAEGLSVTIGGVTYDNWRLPENPDGQYATLHYDGTGFAGWNIISSELGHLFYAGLGNTGSKDVVGSNTGCGGALPTCLTNMGAFQNLVSGRYYSSDHAAISYYAWYFDLQVGNQYVTPNYTAVDYGIAVHPGMTIGGPVDVEATNWSAIKVIYR